jgi:hypothetical protein
MRRVSITLIALAIVGCGGDGCAACNGANPDPPAQAPALEQAPSAEQVPSAQPSSEGSRPTAAETEAVKKQLEAMIAEGNAPSPEFPKAGFSEVRVIDEAPLCVFPSYQEFRKVKFPEQAKEQTLQAGSKVVFGAFAPWCVNENCDQRPSLQCEAKVHGESIVVTSKYWGDHKDGAKCTSNCRSITAGCPTPELKEGLYTVHHGKKQFELQIPTVLDKPCF